MQPSQAVFPQASAFEGQVLRLFDASSEGAAFLTT